MGTAQPSAGFNPDSALVRAVILASCKPLAGIGGVWKNSREGAANFPYSATFYRMRIPSTFAPNFIEGFGLPILDHAVFMAGSTNGHMMLYVAPFPQCVFVTSCAGTPTGRSQRHQALQLHSTYRAMRRLLCPSLSCWCGQIPPAAFPPENNSLMTLT